MRWSRAPPVAVARLAERLGLDPGVLEGYGRRSHTRSDHLLLVARYLGWKSAPAGGGEMKELEQFLLDRAMEHDSPTLLFNLATEFLMSVKTIRPGVSILERMIISARTGATALTSELVGHLLTGQRCSDLDRLLVSDAGLGMTRLAWLTKPAVEATASAVLTSRHLVETVNALADRGVAFASLHEGIDTTTSTGRLVFHIFAALAEFERELIAERAAVGRAAARARGRLGGRPAKLSPEQTRHGGRGREKKAAARSC